MFRLWLGLNGKTLCSAGQCGWLADCSVSISYDNYYCSIGLMRENFNDSQDIGARSDLCEHSAFPLLTEEVSGAG